MASSGGILKNGNNKVFRNPSGKLLKSKYNFGKSLKLSSAYVIIPFPEKKNSLSFSAVSEIGDGYGAAQGPFEMFEVYNNGVRLFKVSYKSSSGYASPYIEYPSDLSNSIYLERNYAARYVYPHFMCEVFFNADGVFYDSRFTSTKSLSVVQSDAGSVINSAFEYDEIRLKLRNFSTDVINNINDVQVRENRMETSELTYQFNQGRFNPPLIKTGIWLDFNTCYKHIPTGGTVEKPCFQCANTGNYYEIGGINEPTVQEQVDYVNNNLLVYQS